MKSLGSNKNVLPVTRVTRVVRRPDEVVILGCGPIRVADKWTMRTLRESTVGGAACGGLHRVEAAACLYDKWSNVVVVPTSSHSALDNNLEEPNQWEAESQILQDLGVPAENIKPEKKSINTVSQLAEVLMRAAKDAETTSGNYYLITNRYHLPRVQVMLSFLCLLGEDEAMQNKFEYESRHITMMRSLIDQPQKGYVSGLLKNEREIISTLKARKVHFYLLAAEDVLQMQKVEQEVSHEPYFTDMVAAEDRGIKQLLSGTYGR